MIEGIKEIGSIIIAEEPNNLLKHLTDKIPIERKGKKQHIVIIEFNTINKKISFDFEETKEDTAEKYLWIGNAEGPNSPQDRFTTNNLDYLISQTIPNLKKVLPIDELSNLLKDFYFDTGRQRGQEERYRFVLDIDKLDISSRSSEDLWKEASMKEKPSQQMIKLVSKEIHNHLKEETGLSGDDIVLFSIKVNGTLLSDLKEYHAYLLRKKIEEAFENSTVGKCYLCGNYDNISFDTTKFHFKYYITDKIGFSSNLKGKSREGFSKNFVFCRTCYQSLLAGETFIENNLRSSLGGIRLYIIPQFVLNTLLVKNKLEKWSEYLKISFNSTVNIKGLEKLKESIEEYKDYEDEKNNFFLNLLFYRPSQSEFRVLKLIRDIPPSRLDFLKSVASDIGDLGQRIISELSDWYITLEKIYYLLPIRLSNNENIDYGKILGLYDSLFSGKPMSYHFLISQFIELASVYRFEKFSSYNTGKRKLSDSDVGLVYALLEANLFLLYLRRLNLLGGGKGMESSETTDLKQEIKDFIKEMGYSENQVALFLLGYLIGEIGSAPSQRISSKPILNKIAFQGMNSGKLLRLTNDVFEKLIQYKKLTHNEVIFAEMKRLFDKNILNWSFSDQENVFYVLSGYAYATHRAIKGREKNERSSEEENNV